jgi:putative spermidine/putrescine transport system permease protein
VPESDQSRRSADVPFGWRIIDALVALRRFARIDRLERARPYIMLAPAVLLVSLLAIGLLYLAWLSAHAFDAFLFEQGPFSFEQYRRLIELPSGPFYRQTLYRTLWISILVTVVSLVMGMPVAYFIVRTRSRVLRVATLVLLLVPFLMGEIVRAFGWFLVLGNQGLLAWVQSWFGFSGGILGTELAVIVGMMQVSIPLATLLILPAITRIPPDLERAAETLGASPSRVWRHVLVPLARPGIAGGAAVVLLLNLAEFDMPAILGLGRLPFVANVIRDVYTLQANLYLGSAFSLVLLMISTLLVLGLLIAGGAQRRSRRVRSEAGG